MRETPQLSAETKIRVDDLSKAYWSSNGAVLAINGISLAQREGEFISLLGPSGCGKSTLLRILAGLDQCSAGSVSIRDSGDGSPLTGMVFQEQGVLPWLTVRGNVSYPLWLRGVPRAERRRRAEDMLHRVGLGDFIDRHPHQLSGGMKQRVALARAFVHQPQVLLMDEPFAALDEQTKLVLQEELLDLWEASGRTVVYVTHSIDEALTLSDRVIVMSARPSKLKLEIEVDFPRPRSIVEMRETTRYGELWATVWTALRDEVIAAKAAEEEAS